MADAQVETKKSTSQAPWVVELASASEDERARLGGKGERLSELIQAGFEVPGGFCITTDGFRALIDASPVAKLARQVETTPEERTQMRQEMAKIKIPEALRSEILDAYDRLGRPRVAVRSSAIGEDSAAASFAGQHDTVLNVEGEERLLDAVRSAWASLWSERAWSYRQAEYRSDSDREKGDEGRGAAASPEIALVVQKMADADVAGVMFTTSPVPADGDNLVIESCWGLGETLVSGRAESDAFVVDPEAMSIIDRRVRYKRTMMKAGTSGEPVLSDVPVQCREVATLADEQVLELARLGLKLREHYGSEQDVEWAVVDGTIFLLQTRPVTRSAQDKPRRIDPYLPCFRDQIADNLRERSLWSRMDIGELFTGIMTPLGLSFTQYYQYNVHADCLAGLGLRDTGEVKYYMGYVQGFMYLNVSYTAYQLSQTPPGRDPFYFMIRFSSEEVDLESYETPFGAYPAGPELRRSVRHWIVETLKEYIFLRRRSRRMVSSRFAEYDRFRKLDLTRMSLPDLKQELDRDLDYFLRMHRGYMPYYIHAWGFYRAIESASESWMGENSAKIKNRFKTDMVNLRSLDSARELYKLVERVRGYEGVERIIRTTQPEEVAAALKADPVGARFWDNEIEAFLRSEGVRGRQEMEITNLRWVDDPSYVFQMMRKYLEHGISVEDVLARGQKERWKESEELLAQLPLRRRMLFRLYIKLYSFFGELRETTRMAMTTSIWLVRSIVYEIGRRMVEEGILRSIDETIYLDFADILDYVNGKKTATEAFPRRKLEERRREHGHNMRLPEPPLTLIGPYDPSSRVRRTGDGNVVTGLGTSPGRVIGRARVIHDLVHQAEELEPGEILVTSFTDASWTPLFLIAAGVVTDIGSMLSHSSIVAREFSIPSVVNTKTATTTIHTGDMVIVDGDEGVVEIQRA